MAEASFLSLSEVETQHWAEGFAKKLTIKDNIALMGNLGAGKTVIARGVARGLNYRGFVTSPSFALINEYEADIPIFHLDLYRLGANADWEEIGLDYYLNRDGLALVEWPERVAHLGIVFTYKINIIMYSFNILLKI